MGAEWFEEKCSGATAKEAFDEAVERAYYDYGHQGYTGSIAEKREFVMLCDEPLTKDAALALLNQCEEGMDPRIEDKWGPAGCIPVDDGTFFFIGWASS